MSAAVSLLLGIAVHPAYGISVPGDYNHDGVVSHGDYSLLGDTFGQLGPQFAGADGTGDGIVSFSDYAFYEAHYGNTSGGDPPVPPPGVLPFTVIGAPTPGGEVQWTFTLSDGKVRWPVI